MCVALRSDIPPLIELPSGGVILRVADPARNSRSGFCACADVTIANATAKLSAMGLRVSFVRVEPKSARSMPAPPSNQTESTRLFVMRSTCVDPEPQGDADHAH